MSLRIDHERCISSELLRQKRFSPKFCPNPSCSAHLPHKDHGSFFLSHGHNTLKRFPYQTRRFLCKLCNRSFSSSSFRLHYRQKIWGLNTEIATLYFSNTAKREIARLINHSEHLVRIRLLKLAKHSYLKHSSLLQHSPIQEPIAYDGLENFSFSQYEPNHINHAIGKNSLFLYDFGFSPLNRKGRMSTRQKKRKKQLERSHGTFPPRAIRDNTRSVFRRLLSRIEPNHSLTLYTDRHFQYERAIGDLKRAPITHIKISSKAARNYRNPLFAVNNIDMQARHNLSAFKRETIAFSKHSIAMVECFALYACYRNYMRPKFWGTHRSDPECSKRSPAMEIGITNKIYSIKEFFKERVFKTHVTLNEEWERFYHRIDPHSRHVIDPCINTI